MLSNTSLEGVLLQSLFIYFRFYPKDPSYLKVWVRDISAFS